MSLSRLLLAVVALGAVSPRALVAQSPAPERVRQQVRAYREAHQGDILREFAELLAIPNLATDSVNIRRNAAAVIAMLERRGVRARLLESPGSPPAVYGELTAPGAARTITIYAHYDGQPVDTAQWTTAPWRPTLRDRALADGGRPIAWPDNATPVSGEARIYARSASDDKAPIVAAMAALDALRSAGVAPSVNLKFFFEGEEEAGSTHLADMLRRHAELLRADLWLFCDGPVHQSGRPQVVFGARGVMGLELTVYGPTRALHSGHYGNWAPNPIAMLAKLLASMRSDEGRILIPGFYADVRAVSPAERAALAAVPAADTTLRRTLSLGRTEGGGARLVDQIMLPALNFRGVRAGGVGALAANAIPTEARASIDFRLVADQTPERVRSLVEAHLRAQGYFVAHDSVDAATLRAHPRVVRVEWEAGYAGYRTAMDLAPSRAVVRAAREAAGGDVVVLPALGGSLPLSTFAAVVRAPLIVTPIANYDNNQHAANENLRVQNLWDAIELFGVLVSRLGALWPADAGVRP